MNIANRDKFFPVLVGLVLVACLNAQAPATKVRQVRWQSGAGAWTDAARWTGGLPDAFSRAEIHGESDIVVRPGRHVVGSLALGTAVKDRVRLHIDGGELVVRRNYLLIGEVGGSTADIVVDAGALHCDGDVYFGGANHHPDTACKTTLHFRGGSFVSRSLALAGVPGATATLHIEGSLTSFVHVLDGIHLGVYGKGPGSVSTLAFTLDERGVTPLSIQSRNWGLTVLTADNRARLRVALKAVPPRDDVTLVAANVPMSGTFDELPEGSEIIAEHGGRTYRWTLTYRGGKNGCHVVLKNVRGHAADAPITHARAMPETPRPLWLEIPAQAEVDNGGTPPFDGAEGFGATSRGGRGGKTIFVENLNDSGPGSLRAAVSAKEPRIVEFRVGGTIELKSRLTISEPYLTVAGQTAAEPGITLRGWGVVVSGHDVILRHFRIRPGGAVDDEDALWFLDAERCIADHLSVSWGTDEVLSITGLSDSITIQWCVIAEGLNFRNHGYASIAGGERVTWHHNLFAHHVSRMPRFSGIVHADFRNNVLYNWGHTSGYGEFERVNYVANYLKTGPSTTQRPPRILTGEATADPGSLFLHDNVMEGNERMSKYNWLGVGYERVVEATAPFIAPAVRTDTALAAFDRVLREAGATSPRRDAVDERVVREVRTGKGRIVKSVEEAGR